jgi:predicted transposase YdaD
VDRSQALVRLRNDQVLADLEPLLSFFASFVFDISLVQQMMRWDMAVLWESPWYNQILQEGHKKGRQEEASGLILRLLKRRFGELSEAQEERIRQLSTPQLEDLGEALLDFMDMADLDGFLAKL